MLNVELGTPEANNVRITREGEDGTVTVLTLTSEGIIIDCFDQSGGEVLGTSSETWDELRERLIEHGPFDHNVIPLKRR